MGSEKQWCSRQIKHFSWNLQRSTALLGNEVTVSLRFKQFARTEAQSRTQHGRDHHDSL
jgi:hypothetical protein